MKKLIAGLLIFTMAATPLKIEADEPPPENMGLALCIVAVAGIAVTAIYIVAKRCQPKYYWLCDDDQPPKFWVATATKKQCAIEGWHRIGGPYTTPQDAPAIHPSPTNRVELVAGPVENINVQTSQDGHNWTTVSEFRGDEEDFSYSPTNTGMFRLEISQ